MRPEQHTGALSMNPYHEGVDKSMPPHEERVRRASEAVFANAGANSYADYPAFHLASPSGWMNDPNGLIYYRERLTLRPALTTRRWKSLRATGKQRAATA